ncbi:transmembrane protein 116-like [Nerophis lumbriciformis]|uniref:transmembrane protein 116-like n=1 Tax=Nerophis lumbriciformis TaxID=546530 RepID=UPI002AE01D33|nr:transmembrane protein 116-like [Nerophis lumbriciformis]
MQRVPAAKMTALLCGVLPVILMAPVFIRGSVGRCAANCSDLYRGPLMLPVAARQPVRACLVLRVYSGAIFLAAFFLTLVGMMMIMGKARDVIWLPWQPAAGLLPFAGLSDAGVPAHLRPLLGTRGVSGDDVIEERELGRCGRLRHSACCWRGRGRLAWRDADTQTPLLRAQKRNYRTWL